MKSSVEKLNDTRVKITVEVPFDELSAEFDQAYAALARQIQVPGFRKGKAPRQLIEARIGRGPVIEQVINDMLPSRYGQAVEENDLNVISQPNVEVTKVEDGKLVEFVAEVDVRPEFEVPKFEDINVTVDAIKTDDAEVDKELDRLRERFSTLKTSRAKAAKDLVLTIDLSATHNGEEIKEASAEGLTYIVGSGDFIEGLDEAVTGLKTGESATFTATLPNGDHAGEEGEITVTVQGVKKRVLPEANDEFAQEASEFDTIEELRADLAETVEERAKQAQAMAIRDEVLKAALDKVSFELPESLVEEQTQAQMQQLLAQVGGNEELLDNLLSAQDMDRAKFEEQTRESSRNNVRTQIFLDALSDIEQPEVTNDEFTQHILFTAQNYGMDPREFIQRINEAGQMGTLMADLRRGKALASAICKVTVTDSEGNNIDPSEYYGEEDAEQADSEEN
ncbi:trigger factor [Corynebacterium aquilae]|uniref:Trigger factor n=1 Tax=Corynebacterium aquilae DSM 44791 TaxID=1431546 RepID=A0A1L7CHE0_9CORY|nr:trigger factor [Corynebacterium aquilae]APT85266.1 trigger factor [Corynebacterium aquilae DSM 44791]